jgi:hypothetical protein
MTVGNLFACGSWEPGWRTTALAPTTDLSRQITQTMVHDMKEWRAVFSDRTQ